MNLSFWLDFSLTNNQIQYEVFIIGLEILLEFGVQLVIVIRDLLLIINQLASQYKRGQSILNPYFIMVKKNLINRFSNLNYCFK
jgi:ribonuclease HI